MAPRSTLSVSPDDVVILGLDETTIAYDETHPSFDRERLAALDADSPDMVALIASMASLGMQQLPGVVRLVGTDGAEYLVAHWGRRRIFAARCLGFPAIDVREIPAEDATFEAVVAENLFRVNDPITAKASRASRAVKSIMREHAGPPVTLVEDVNGVKTETTVDPVAVTVDEDEGDNVYLAMAIDQVATMHDVDPMTIRNWLVIDNLCGAVREMIDSGDLTASNALTLSGIDDPEAQLRAAKRMVREDANVEKARIIANEEGGGGEGDGEGSDKPAKDKQKYPSIGKRALIDLLAFAKTAAGKTKVQTSEDVLDALAMVVGRNKLGLVLAADLGAAKEWRAANAKKKGRTQRADDTDDAEVGPDENE